MGGLTIHYRNKENPMAAFKADRRLYLTHDGRVVEEGDKDAAFLLAHAGRDILAADAEAYGLTCGPDGKVLLPAPAPAPQPEEPKKAAKPQDKAAKKSEDKATEKK